MISNVYLLHLRNDNQQLNTILPKQRPIKSLKEKKTMTNYQLIFFYQLINRIANGMK